MRRLLLVVLLGCGGAPAEPARPTPTTNAAPLNEEAPVANDWAVMTRSPAPASDETRDAREVALLSACGTEDASLTKVARDIAEARAHGVPAPDAEGVVARLRRAGDPHVWPRLFVATGPSPIDETKVQPSVREGVCGAAFASQGGAEVLVMISAESLADLAPLPTRARTGEWLTLEARLRVPARSAKLVVLGPRGLPRNVPTSLDGDVVRARFALDQPGAFTVQLLGELADGPKPLLEARVFADVTPAGLGDETPAPGEAPGDDAAALARMVASLRVAEGLPPLVHDARLDVFARAHTERMRAARSVAHDLGDGDFKERFEADGTLTARAVGENVAHARSVLLAHRALYASPSHRMNLLRADYTHFGVAVSRGEDGSVYACETFLSRTRN